MDEQRPDDETEAFELDWADLPETFTFDMVSQLSIGHLERLEELADDLTPEQRVSLAAAEHELFAPFAEAMSSIMPRIKLPHTTFGTTGADILGLNPSCFASLQRSLMPALTHANRIAVTSLVSSPALTRLVAEQRTILAKQLRVSLFPTPAMGGHLLAAMRDLATASSAPPDNLPNLDGLGRAYELVETGVLDSEGLERANEQIEADPQLLAAVEHAADLLASNAPSAHPRRCSQGDRRLGVRLLDRSDGRRDRHGRPGPRCSPHGPGCRRLRSTHLAKGALHLFDKALPPSSSNAEVDQNEEDDGG